MDFCGARNVFGLRHVGLLAKHSTSAGLNRDSLPFGRRGNFCRNNTSCLSALPASPGPGPRPNKWSCRNPEPAALFSFSARCVRVGQCNCCHRLYFLAEFVAAPHEKMRQERQCQRPRQPFRFKPVEPQRNHHFSSVTTTSNNLAAGTRTGQLSLHARRINSLFAAKADTLEKSKDILCPQNYFLNSACPPKFSKPSKTRL